LKTKEVRFFEKLRTIYPKKHCHIPEELVPKYVWLCRWCIWRLWLRTL